MPAPAGARVVARASPEEKVGVFARRSGAIQVVEYSELGPDVAASVNPQTGQLNYNWGNICMHYFRVQFLEKAQKALKDASVYHVARKKIPSKSGPVQVCIWGRFNGGLGWLGGKKPAATAPRPSAFLFFLFCFVLRGVEAMVRCHTVPEQFGVPEQMVFTLISTKTLSFVPDRPRVKNCLTPSTSGPY